MRRVLTGVALGVVGTLVLTGTAFAATGGTFVLGRSNAASSQTLLTNSGASPVLALSTRAGQVPLAVSAAAGKATNLDADRVDGLEGNALQRRVTGSCPSGQAVTGVDVSGGVGCTSTQDSPVILVVARMQSGFGLAACPQGTLPLGGGVVPDQDSGAAAVLVTSPYFGSDGTGGWQGRAATFQGSGYNGTGIVSVSCSRNAQFPPAAGALQLAP